MAVIVGEQPCGARGQSRDHDDSDRLCDWRATRSADGLVASLNRPGGNVTGVAFLSGALGAKRLELLRQLVPTATTIAVLVNPTNPEYRGRARDVQAAAQAIGQQLIILEASSDREIETAFATFSPTRG